MAEQDFKLLVGLDVDGSVSAVDKDIGVLATKVKRLSLKAEVREISTNKTNLQKVLDKRVSTWKTPLQLKADIAINEKQNITAIIQKQLANLSKVPVVKLGVEIDPESLSKVMDTISKELKFDFTPQKKTSNKKSSEHAEERISDFDQSKNFALENLNKYKSLYESLGNGFEELRQEALAAFSTIESELNNMANASDLDTAVTKLQTWIDKYKEASSHTAGFALENDGSDKLLLSYENLWERIVKAKAEQTEFGQQVKKNLEIVKQVSQLDYGDMLPDDLATEFQVALKFAENFEQKLKDIKQHSDLTVGLDGMEKKLRSMLTSLDKIGPAGQGVYSDIEALLNSITELKNKGHIDLYNDEDSEQGKIIKQTFDAILSAYSNVKASYGMDFFNESILRRFDDAKNKLKEFVFQHSRIQNTPELKQMAEDLISVDSATIQTKLDLEQYLRKVNHFQTQCKLAGATALTFADRIKQIGQNITAANLILGAWNFAKQTFSQAVENVKNLDAAMTELKKVTEETDKSYQAFLKSASVQAHETGATLTDTVTSTADFARLGHTMEDAQELSRIATIYKNVGDGFESVTESSEAIISIMGAFNIEAQRAVEIVDALNEVGNKHAISSGGLGRSLQNSASALHEAGASMQEAMALTSAANITVQDPEQVGNALKTIALRIRGTKAELEAMGEDATGAAESTSKLRAEIQALTNVDGSGGVDIMLDENRYKNIYDILKEIAVVWKDLEDVDAAALLELLAGKNRSNILAGLLNNFDDAEKALEHATKSEGSALAENEKYLDSINGKLNQMSASSERLSNVLINSDAFKVLIDGSTTLLNIASALVETFGSFSSILSAIAGVGAFALFDSNDGSWDQSLDSLRDLALELQVSGEKKTQAVQQAKLDTLANDESLLTKIINKTKDLKKLKSTTDDYKKTIGEISELEVQLSDDVHESWKAFTSQHDVLKEGRGFVAKYTADSKAMISSLKATTVAGKAASVAFNALKATFASMVLNIVVSGLIEMGKALYNNVLTANSLTDEISELNDELSSLSKNRDSFESAAQTFSDLSRNPDRTEEEQQTWTDSQNQLKEIFPEIEGYYNAAGDFVITASNKMEELLSLYDESIKKNKELLMDTYMEKTMFTDDDDQTYQGQRTRYKNLQNGNTRDLRIQQKVQTTGSTDALTGSESERWDYLKQTTDESGWKRIAQEAKEDAIEMQRILDDMRKNAISAISTSEEWTTLSDEDKQAIEKFVGTSDFDTVDSILAQWHGDGQDLIDFLQNEFSDGIDAAKESMQPDPTTTFLTQLPDDATSQSVIVAEMKLAEEAAGALAAAYKELRDDGAITAETIASLGESFGSCEEEWSNFLDLVGSGDMTLSSLSGSLNELLSAYVKEKALLGQVNENTQGLLQSMLESIGVTNAEEIAAHALNEALAEVAVQKIAAAIPDLANMTNDEWVELYKEASSSQEVAAALYKLYYAKLAAADGGLASATETEIQRLRLLAQAAGVAGEALLIYDQYNALRAQTGASLGIDVDAIEAQRAAVEKKMAEIPNSFPSQQWEANWNDVADEASGATSKIKTAFKKMYDELKYQRDMNLISEEKYLAQLLALNEKYNKQNVETYRKYQLEIFNGLKSLAAKKINDQADAQIKALKKQRKETEKYYDDLIEKEQEKLDALRKEWEEQDKLLKIEQARAALAKAQSQNTAHIYRDGEGFVWEPDQDAIQDANDNLTQAIQDHQRWLEELAIEERIDQLEEAKEKALEIIDEEIEKVEEWRDTALEALEEVQFTMEDFLEFFEEFGIKIDEELLKMMEDIKETEATTVDAISNIQGSIDSLTGKTVEIVTVHRTVYATENVGSVENSTSTRGANTGGLIGTKNTEASTRGANTGGLTKDTPPRTNSVIGYSTEGWLRANGYYASGTLSVPHTGMYLTDEEGPEIKIPGKGTFQKLTYGTSVLPANVSKNLWAIGAKPLSFAKGIANMISNKTSENHIVQQNFGEIVLPNVTNAEQFTKELQHFAADARQWAYSK